MAAFTFQKITPFSSLHKVFETNDGRARTYGPATAEVPDKDGEICDYGDAKKQYEIWSKSFENATKAAGQEVSLGNIRIMHTAQMGGKATELNFDDAAKTILLGTEAADSDTADKIKRGFYTGLSHAGSYLYRRCNTCATDVAKGNICPTCKCWQLMRYAPILAEVSYVDNPCLAKATFDVVKADGTVEQRHFESIVEDDRRLEKLTAEVEELKKAIAATTSEARKAAEYLVTADGTQHLPYTDDNGKPNHRLMGAAWAALHGGYRGNKYDGPDKDGAITRLTSVYEKEGMETPGAKCARAISAVIEKSAAKKGVEKGLYEASCMANVLEALAMQHQMALWERAMEGDESALPEEFLALLEQAADVFLSQVTEETKEITAAAAANAQQQEKAAEKSTPAAEPRKGTNMETQNAGGTLVKALTAAGFEVEKAHSIAHHLRKMAGAVSGHFSKGVAMHNDHHAAMMGCDSMDKAKGLAESHLHKGLDLHEDHKDLMESHMAKLHKIFGADGPGGENVPTWDSVGKPENNGVIPSGATSSNYSLKSTRSPELNADDLKKMIAGTIQEIMGDFFKGVSEGATEATTDEPVAQPIVKNASAAGIGDRRNVQWPVINTGGVTKATDGAANPGATQKQAEPVTAADVHKAMRNDPEALEKLGFGRPGQSVPDHVRLVMSRASA